MAIPCQKMNYKKMLPSAGDGIEVQHRKSNPVNGSSFTSSNTFAEYRIGGNQVNKCLDGCSIYIKAKFTGTATNALGLTKYGVLSAISRVEVESTGGVKICDINRYHVLNRIKTIQTADRYFREADGVVLHGTSRGNVTMGTDAAQTAANTVLSKTTGNVYVIPLDFLGLNSYIPLWGDDGLVFRIHWATAFDYVTEGTSATLAATGVAIADTSINYDVITLSDATVTKLYKDTGGTFIIENPTYIRTGTVMAASESENINMGIGRSKVMRLFMCLRDQATTAHGYAGIDRLSMVPGNLTSAYLELDGVKLNDKTVEFATGSCAENLALLRKAQGLTLSDKKASNIDLVSFTTTVTSSVEQAPGTFFVVFDLTDGTDTALSSSGINAKGNGNFNLNLVASAATSGTVDIFAEYENTLILDMSPNGDRMFSVFN